MRRGLWAIMAVLALGGHAFGAEVKATVKYVTASVIYLDQGRAAGISPGDKGEIFHGEERIAGIEVSFIAENSASCKILESSGDVVVGDTAIVQIIAPVKASAAEAEQIVTDQSDASAEGTEKGGKAERKGPKLRGRAAISYYAQDYLDGSEYDYAQPSLYLKASISDLFDSNVAFNIRMRARRIYRSSDENKWENRFYEASVRKTFDKIPVRLEAGRFSFPYAPGIGYLDGMTGQYTLSERYSAGAFFGYNPDFGGGGARFDQPKLGVYGRMNFGDYTSARRISTTMALAGSYSDGEPDREYLYLSNDLTIRRGLSLYQSCEVELNRGWRREAEGKALKLSSLYVSVRWMATEKLTLTLSHDDRIPYRELETRALPDSLFEDASRQGLRLGMSLRLPGSGYGGLDGGIRRVEGGGNESRNGSGYVRLANVYGTKIGMTARMAAYESEFNRGYQPSLSLTREVTRSAQATLQGGQNSYTYTNGGGSTVNWVRLTGDWWARKSVYGSASYELRRGGGSDANHLFVDIGVKW